MMKTAKTSLMRYAVVALAWLGLGAGIYLACDVQDKRLIHGPRLIIIQRTDP